MGRLTKRIETEFPRGIQKGIELDEMLDVYEDDMFYECADKLAHYEDMEEQGRLIEVVRCKDCAMESTCVHTQYQGEEGYCSKAEPKELEVQNG